MRITADTNVLVRAAVLDDPSQAAVAADMLRQADIIVVTLVALCEFVSVLGRGYKWADRDIHGIRPRSLVRLAAALALEANSSAARPL